MTLDDDLRVRPGHIRTTRNQRAKPFIAQALAAAERAGEWRAGYRHREGQAPLGRAASLTATRALTDRSRSVVIKAHVVRHGMKRAPLSAHLAYLRRDSITKDGDPARMFGVENDGSARDCTA